MATASEKRAATVVAYKSRLKRNTYTNATADAEGRTRNKFWGNPEGVDPGWSDCSSSVRAALKRCAGVDPGSNTHTQLLNRARGVVVDEAGEGDCYPDESKLKIGDCLYFKGNQYHVMDVGHVELYTGSNECCGHGSAKGPTKKNLRSYCASRASASRKYFMAVRWIQDDMEGDGTLKIGDIGSLVQEMQELLLQHGYALPLYGADAEFGQETLAALTQYQLDNALEAAGICDAATWKALRAKEVADDEINDVNPYPQPTGNVARGATGDAVRWVQWELTDAGYGSILKAVDGVFGTQTKTATLAFQKAVFKDDPAQWDGVVGPITRQALIDVHDEIV